MYMHNNHCHRVTARLQLNILLLFYYIMWRFKENEEEEDDSISMAAAGFMFLASQVSK